MKIVLVVAGAGPMFCGACARDAALARTFIRLGHDAWVLPVYTPLRLEASLAAPQMPLHLGGIGAFLRENVPSYDTLPAIVRRWLDAPGLIAWASRFAVQTSAKDLGVMTVSMLRGVEGRHRSEIERIACDVAESSPDWVVLPNSMLLGLAVPLKRTTQAKIVCQVQGEDGFLNELPDDYRTTALDLMRRHAGSVDSFLAPSRCHAASMASLLGQPLDRFAIAPVAVESAEMAPLPSDGRLTIGCLSSIRRAKGQDLLLDALNEVDGVRAVFAGRTLEPRYGRELRTRGPRQRVEFLGEIPPSRKPAFFAGCDAVCLPSRLEESRGIAALEALAAGRVVIAPDRGVFEEFETEGVIRFAAEDSASLASVLAGLDRTSLAERGLAGQAFVRSRYSPDAAETALASVLAA